MSARHDAELVGLVLAGGDSSRMGTDKGCLVIDGRPQVLNAVTLLRACCRKVFVAVRPGQALAKPYSELPLIVDEGDIRGPGAGLRAAWRQWPENAFLVCAVDMLRVDADLLRHLVAHRDTAREATAYRNASGLIEPLCAIWEPGLAGALEAAAARGSPSLRRILEQADTALIEPPNTAKLASIDTPAALAEVRENGRGG